MAKQSRHQNAEPRGGTSQLRNPTLTLSLWLALKFTSHSPIVLGPEVLQGYHLHQTCTHLGPVVFRGTTAEELCYNSFQGTELTRKERFTYGRPALMWPIRADGSAACGSVSR